MIRTSRRFALANPELLLIDGLSLYFAILNHDEIAFRQLVREYETSYPKGYGKQVLTKVLAFLPDEYRGWLRDLY